MSDVVLDPAAHSLADLHGAELCCSPDPRLDSRSWSLVCESIYTSQAPHFIQSTSNVGTLHSPLGWSLPFPVALRVLQASNPFTQSFQPCTHHLPKSHSWPLPARDKRGNPALAPWSALAGHRECVLLTTGLARCPDPVSATAPSPSSLHPCQLWSSCKLVGPLDVCVVPKLCSSCFLGWALVLWPRRDTVCHTRHVPAGQLWHWLSWMPSQTPWSHSSSLAWACRSSPGLGH